MLLLTRQLISINQTIMEVIKSITQAWRNIFISFFDSDMDVMSSEARRIFSNVDDKKNLSNALDELKKNPDKPQKITLSNKEEITLVS